jgi:hypothetical protein
MPWFNGRHAFLVESPHQGRDGIIGSAANAAGGGRVAGPIGHGQDEPGTFDMRRRLGAGTADAQQHASLIGSQGTQRVFLATGHQAPL